THAIGIAHCSLIEDRLYNFKNIEKPEPNIDRGVLENDQELALDSLTKSMVEAIARSTDFNFNFGQAMAKVDATQVLTGTQGEIFNFYIHLMTD
nr:hypothetical protein [Tanacetum cinerariifolium]